MPRKLVPVDHDPFKPEDEIGKVVSQLEKLMLSAMNEQAEITRKQIESLHEREELLTRTLLNAITAPKRIIHDKDGRPVGVKVAD